MSVDERLSAAKMWLTSADDGRLPYLSHALFSMPTVVTDRVEVLTTDEHWRLYANPDAVAELPVPQLAQRLAHLVWHLLFDHATRARVMDVGPRTLGDWETATHAVIAETLEASGMREHALPPPPTVPRLVAGASAEEHYARLTRLAVLAEEAPGEGSERPPDAGCGSGCDGLPRGYELPATEDAGALSPLAAMELRKHIAVELGAHLRGRGTEPGEWLRWIEQMRAPRLPWPQLLAAAVLRAVTWAAGQPDYTYSRFSRRQYASPTARLPGMRRPVPEVALVLDTSGSVDDELLAQALGEVEGAIRATGVRRESVSVVACDADVQSASRVQSARQVVLGGGGGTDLRVGIAQAAAMRPRPQIIVVLTDGHTPWPDAPVPGTAVVAGLLGHAGRDLPRTPDWVTRVECVVG